MRALCNLNNIHSTLNNHNNYMYLRGLEIAELKEEDMPMV